MPLAILGDFDSHTDDITDTNTCKAVNLLVSLHPVITIATVKTTVLSLFALAISFSKQLRQWHSLKIDSFATHLLQSALL